MLSWPETGEPKILAHAELALPADQSYRTTESWREREDHLPRFSYLTSTAPDVNGRSGAYREDKLYVFDWADGPRPTPRLVIPLPTNVDYVAVAKGELRVSTSSGHAPDHHVYAASFDADRPEALPNNGNWPLQEQRNRPWHDWDKEFERFGGEYVLADERGDIAYLSDRLGLRVARRIRLGQWEIVGECRASPLSVFFRQYTRSQSLDNSLLIEHSYPGITAYDVADPSKPRRVGFFNAVGLSLRGTSVFVTGRFMVVHEFDLITVLDRPRTGVQ
jgi:hypothetical protein